MKKQSPARERNSSPRNLDRKVPKTFRLATAKVAAAQRILGTANATETIEVALDLVVFRSELVHGTAALLGTRIEKADE